MDLKTITKEAVRTRIPWADITSCVSQDLPNGSRLVTTVLECPTPNVTTAQALEECFTGLGYIYINARLCGARADDSSPEKWEFEVFGTYPNETLWRRRAANHQTPVEESTQESDDKPIDMKINMKTAADYAAESHALAEQSMRETFLLADKFVVTPDNDMLLTHVMLDRYYLWAERWLFTCCTPIEACEGQDEAGNECFDYVFLTDEGHQLVMREDNNDTMSFFLKSPDGEMKIVEPNAITERFCSFVPMKNGQADGAPVFITCPGLEPPKEETENPVENESHLSQSDTRRFSLSEQVANELLKCNDAIYTIVDISVNKTEDKYTFSVTPAYKRGSREQHLEILNDVEKTLAEKLLISNYRLDFQFPQGDDAVLYHNTFKVTVEIDIVNK